MNIRIGQKKDVVYENGQSPLFLRFTINRKSKFVSLGISALPEHWNNEKQIIRSECPDNSTLNAIIKSKHMEPKLLR